MGRASIQPLTTMSQRYKGDAPGDSTQEIRLAIQRKVQAGSEPGLRRGGAKGFKERRSGQDRRGWHVMPPPPFVDGQGNVVTGDRRKLPDRRVNNISVRWATERSDED